MKRFLFPAALLLFLLFLPGPASAQSTGSGEEIPLLTWDLLRQSHYGSGGKVSWAKGLSAFDGQMVRLEGYLLPRFGAQDSTDLLIAAAHPFNLFCGPTDMTALVEVYLPGFEVATWPSLPVEVWGRFMLSKRPEDLQAIYRLRAEGWRPLKRWVQNFPGVVEDPIGGEDN